MENEQAVEIITDIADRMTALGRGLRGAMNSFLNGESVDAETAERYSKATSIHANIVHDIQVLARNVSLRKMATVQPDEGFDVLDAEGRDRALDDLRAGLPACRSDLYDMMRAHFTKHPISSAVEKGCNDILDCFDGLIDKVEKINRTDG